MTLIKRYPVFLACVALVAILIASSTWHYSHKGKSGTPSLAPSPSLNADGTPSEPASSGIDWVLVSNAIGSLIAAIVGVWDLARKMFPGAAAVKSISPDAATLGDDIVRFTLGTGTGPAYELAMRVAAEKLLAKYTITVRVP